MCRVDTTETVHTMAQRGSKVRGKRKWGRQAEEQQEELPQEVFHPVLCDTCSTRLGVIDSEEVYHFTSVVASNA